jgi:phosphoribosyl 1,2-cyclic phosphodiesterase
MTNLSFRFWGVRGSLPSAGPQTARYGGNTPCLEVLAGDTRFIVDLGSGLRALGGAIGFGPHAATVLMTHYHYDHVQGLPFFGPMFNPANKFEIWGPSFEGRDVRSLVAGQLVKPYFPVGLEVMRAQLSFHGIQAGETRAFGPVTVKTCALFHPDGCLGYRFEAFGRTLVYCTDVEQDHGPHDARMVAFARGADTFIVDAMYTPDEYPSRKGFGHATWKEAVRWAHEAQVKKLVLCHHDPARTDDGIDGLVALARSSFVDTTAAREQELVAV